MEDLDNPILYIEEFGPAPDLSHRYRVPEAALVYRLGNGRIHEPRGGYTAGELMWYRPREVYLVDVAPHMCRIECFVSLARDSEPIALTFTVVWQVINPTAAVAARMTQPLTLGLQALEGWCRRSIAVASMASEAEIFRSVTGRLPHSFDLQGGLRVDVTGLHSVGAAATDRSSRQDVLRHLYGDGHGDAWRADFDLAQSALTNLPDDPNTETALGAEESAQQRAVTQRFAELVDRIGELRPYEGGES